MSQEKKQLPSSFFIFLMIALAVILILQGMSQNTTPSISFSHQVEHLVNLKLIEKTESKKIALNDNLVTFKGKFDEQLSDESKSRYRYLELLDQHHHLRAEKERLSQELDDSRKGVFQSAELFLYLSSTPIPRGGYVVVDSMYDTLARQNAIVINEISNSHTMPNFYDVSKRLDSSKLEQAELSGITKDMVSLLQAFRSPTLGIGVEAMKQRLKSLETALVETNKGNDAAATYAQLTNCRNGLSEIIDELNMPKQEVRLSGLRSVRNYKLLIEQYNTSLDEIEKNDTQLDKARQSVAEVTWYFNNHELSTRALEKENPEEYHRWFLDSKTEYEHFAENHGLAFKAPDQPRNLVLEKEFKSEEPSPNYLSYLFTILPVVLVIFFLYFIFSKQMKGMGSGAMNFGKSPAKLLTKDKNKITFKDVAGCEEAKEELQEIVDFLKDPTKFTALGARIPKGVLCVGAPGTGKTLIAKAVAGEADRPFFSISGSDFVEMFVGVGASRIRDLFDQAKKNAPCIIFMDEIDAVGRHRGAGIGGGHDEREQTLNQLLVEMDGFDTAEGVILIAATNRPDVLDKALLRPGRFDRRIIIDLPDIKGRFEILKVHARKIKLDPSVDLMKIARNTPGASGADLANILNEAALLAARRGRSCVTNSEALEACDKVRYGKERKSLELDVQEKKTTAYHESGHAVVALSVKYADPVDKVTIIPRGLSLGATHFMPKKNRVSYWKKELIDQLAVLMGGRVAEEIFVGDISSGAQMDISQATKLTRSMVCEWGMGTLGAVAYDERAEGGQYLGTSGYQEKTYSEETARQIDHEVRKFIDDAHQKAIEIVTQNKDKVQLMTDMLIEFETLDREDVIDIINGTWDAEKKRKKLKDADELAKPSAKDGKPISKPQPTAPTPKLDSPQSDQA